MREFKTGEVSDPAAELPRMPLFGSSWVGRSSVVVCGGGGVGGTGIPSGLAEIRLDGARRKLLGAKFVNTADQIVYHVEWSPDRKRMAWSVEDYCAVVDPESLKVLYFWKTDFTEEEPYQVCSAWNPKGEFLATGGEDKMIRVWRISEDESVPALARKIPGHAKSVQSLHWNCDGELLASAGNEDKCFVWKNVDTVMEMWQFVVKSDSGKNLLIRGCRFSVDEPHILFAWMNETARGPSFIAIINVSDGSVLKRVPVSNNIVTAAGNLSTDGRYIALGTDTAQLHVFSTADLSRVNLYPKLHNMGVTGLSFSPDSELILTVSGDNTFRISKTQKGFSWVFLVLILFLALAAGAIALFVLQQNGFSFNDFHL